MRDSFFVRRFAAEVPDAAGHRSCCTGPFARIPPDYPPFLADRLAHVTALQVKDAADGESIVPGRVYLDTPNRNLMVENGRVRLSDEAPLGGLRPRADLTITDAAKLFGPAMVLVVLTGMGKDGLEGARAVKATGGRVLVEAESTCVVYGMPRAIAEAGLADEVLPLHELPAAIAREAGA